MLKTRSEIDSRLSKSSTARLSRSCLQDVSTKPYTFILPVFKEVHAGYQNHKRSVATGFLLEWECSRMDMRAGTLPWTSAIRNLSVPERWLGDEKYREDNFRTEILYNQFHTAWEIAWENSKFTPLQSLYLFFISEDIAEINGLSSY